MPSYFVVQPNGLLARFSTVVDDFTAMNMTDPHPNHGGFLTTFPAPL